MKILLAGPYHISALAWYCEYALLKMGHRVKVFDYRKVAYGRTYPHPPRLERRAFDLVIRRILGRQPFQSMNTRFLSAVQELDPDLIFVLKGEIFLPETIKRISETSKARLVVWHGDNPWTGHIYRSANAIFSLQFYDLCFVMERYYIPQFKKAGAKRVEYLTFGCEPDVHRSLSLTAEERQMYASDICFVGTYQGEFAQRTRILSALTDFDLRIWGPNWDRAKDPALKRCFAGRPVYGEEMVKVFNASKIAFNVHNEQFITAPNMRDFEAPSSGVLLVTHALAEMPNLYDVGRQVICYSDIADLRNEIDYFLHNSELREEIAKKGQQRAQTEHTYQCRMEEMLRLCE